MDSVSDIRAAVPAMAPLHRGIWRYGHAGATPFTGNLRLLADGRIGGYIQFNEAAWQVDGPDLIFLSKTGKPTTRFTAAHRNAQGHMVLTGAFLAKTNPPVIHVLEAVPEPYQIAPAPGAFPIIQHFNGPRRRNLVIIGANETSLHHAWPRDIPDSERSWDIFISFYGTPENYPPPGPAEYTSLRWGLRKWQAIHAAMHAASPFWEYERIFIIDDDIHTRWSDINKFLEICAAHNLLLASPALKPDCCVNHKITVQEPGTLLRHTSFVEALTPCFTADALRDCIAPAQDSIYGFGLDHLWPLNLGFPRGRIAIVDAVAFDHTRPLATNYPLGQAVAEEKALFKRYGIGWTLGYQVTGTIPLPG